jgi:TonB-linked SusC/RagA family outer membrane protein
MKKIAFFLSIMFFMGSVLVHAQTKKITGKVTSSEDGLPIPGVSVSVKGTTLGTITNVDGVFELTVPNDAQTLTFSFVGMETQDVSISGETNVSFVMKPATIAVGEILVTGAFETKRAAKSTASQTQVVSSDQLNTIRQTNINNALAGKVSGIQVRSQSPVALGRTGEIRLRGEGGFGTGSGGVIYVVDGTIVPNSNDINMDIVEDVSVLSGPSAAALFGSQAANGAIVVTTKRARAGAKGFGVDLASGYQVTNVYVLPDYQNSYAGGANYDLTQYNWKQGDPEHWKPLDGKYYHDYSDDASWGPRMAGQEYIPWYSWYEGSPYTGTTAKLVPQPDNARDFFETGSLWNNTITFSKSTESQNTRISYGNNSVKGNLPGTSLQKHNFSVKTVLDVSKKFSVGANVNFITTLTDGEFDDGYSNQSTGSFNQWFHRDLDMDKMRELKDLRTPGGIWASWNHNNPSVYNAANEKQFYAGNYWYNFYKWFDLVQINNRADRLFGDVFLNYKITNDLSIKGTYRRNQNNTWSESTYSSQLNESGTQTTGNTPEAKGYYFTRTTYSVRENYEAILSYSKTIDDFKINANAGTDNYNSVYKDNGANTVDGLNVPDLFTISNSKSQPNVSNTRQKEKYNSVFVRGDVGFRDYLFAEFTLRNDWYSTLPESNNNVLSKSFGGSFVFSDLLQSEILSYGKLRASWGEIPKTIGIYQYPGFAYGVGQYQWNGNFLMSTPDQLVDPNIHGAVNAQKEVGLELRAFENRVGLTITYWDGSEIDIPYAVSIPNFSGFTSKLINTGEISKKGWDGIVNVRPFWGDFRWEINATFSYLMENKVVKIAEGIDQFTAQSQWGGGTPDMVHRVGEEWGQLYGGGKKLFQAVDGSGNPVDHPNNGKPILNSSGFFVSNPTTYFGNVLPELTGGIQNNFRYKDFAINLNFDYQKGGKFFSLSDMWGTFSGLTARTAVLNDNGLPIRDPVADGGGVHVFGVNDKGEDVDYYVEGQDYYHQFYTNDVYDEFVYDLSFFKLREASISYFIPVQKLGIGNVISKAEFSIVGQNVWLIYAQTRDFDPSEISRAGGEQGQFPGVRSFGANLKLSF